MNIWSLFYKDFQWGFVGGSIGLNDLLVDWHKKEGRHTSLRMNCNDWSDHLTHHQVQHCFCCLTEWTRTFELNYVSCLRYKDAIDDVSPLPFGPRVWFDLEFCIEFSSSLNVGQSSAVNHELQQSNSRKANSASVLHSFASFWSWCSAMFPKVTKYQVMQAPFCLK